MTNTPAHHDDSPEAASPLAGQSAVRIALRMGWVVARILAQSWRGVCQGSKSPPSQNESGAPETSKAKAWT